MGRVGQFGGAHRQHHTHGQGILTGFGTLTELENILKKQRRGTDIAKAEVMYKGRKPVAVNEAQFRSICALWRAGKITATVTM